MQHQPQHQQQQQQQHYCARLRLCGSDRATANELQKKIPLLEADTACLTVCLLSPHPGARRRMSDEGMVATFGRVGDLTKLSRLELRFDPTANSSFYLPAAALTELLQRAKRLVFLMLSGVRISGDTLEMENLAAALRQHQSLSRIYITQSITTEGSAPLYPILKAAAANPNMEYVILGYLKCENTSLIDLCGRDSKLKCLRLIGKQSVLPGGMAHLSQTLSTNNSLTELRIIECPLPEGSGALVAKMLSQNTSLKELSLGFERAKEVLPICKCLCYHNRSLKQMDVFFSHPANENQRNLLTILLTRMLSFNVSLEQLVVQCSSFFLTSMAMEYFLRLNRAGRGRLLQKDASLSTHAFVDAIIAHRHDLFVVHFILSINPSLCQVWPTCKNKTNTKRKRQSSTKKRKLSDSSPQCNGGEGAITKKFAR